MIYIYHIYTNIPRAAGWSPTRMSTFLDFGNPKLHPGTGDHDGILGDG